MNDFLNAINSDGNDEKESSSERYEKLKKEEAGTEDKSMAEKRFQEIKKEAKEEFVRRQEERAQEETEQEEDDGDDVFITH